MRCGDGAALLGLLHPTRGGELFVRQRPCAATNSGIEVLERARRGGVHHAVDSHRAARAIAFADAVLDVASLRGCHFRRAAGSSR